jgi:hypothetical protein
MFESANLDCVVRISDREYDLFLRIDSNTRGHTVWYYFLIKNGRHKRNVCLNICNMTKHHNLYQKVHGQVLLRSGYETIRLFQAETR